MMDSEMLHATEAIESGTYVTFSLKNPQPIKIFYLKFPDHILV